jgi:hypothetical protein
MSQSASSVSDGPDLQRAYRSLRASAVVHWVAGASTAAVFSLELSAVAQERRVGTGIFGLPGLSGPFERLGVDRMLQLGWLYVGLSLLEVVAGILIWRLRRRGAVLSVALIPPAMALWVGFALPGPPLVAALRLALLWSGRRALR